MMAGGFDRIGDSVVALFRVAIPLAIVGAVSIITVVLYGLYWAYRHLTITVQP